MTGLLQAKSRGRAAGRGRIPLTAALAALGCAGGAVLILLTGTPELSGRQVLEILMSIPASDHTGAVESEGPQRLAEIAVVQLRLPRALLALIAGAALGACGALLQDALRNPLASPELLGVSSGAALVVACVGVLHLPLAGPLVAPSAALVGLGVGIMVLAVSRFDADSRTVLFGMACTAFLNGLLICVVAIGSPADVGLFYQYLMGSLAGRSWAQVQLVAPVVAVTLPLALLLTGRLNAMRLGDDVAAGLGVPVARTRVIVMVLSSLMVATVVAVVGPIGFVALLAPHLVRLVTRRVDSRVVIPLAALVGAALLVLVDGAGRALVHPREVAAGVWTALLGAPALLALLRSGRSRRMASW